MEKIDLESDSVSEYFGRISERLTEASSVEQRLLQLYQIAISGETHFRRITFPWRRYRRALNQGDGSAAFYERQVLAALLYEIADTTYLVLGLLDLEQLKLTSSADGTGLSGDSAAQVVRILSVLESQCSRLAQLEVRHNITLDFADPVDEREGITFEEHKHWQDFSGTSIKASFMEYFNKARVLLNLRLNRAQPVWGTQTLREYLSRKNYHGILHMVERLEAADFSALPESAGEKEQPLWQTAYTSMGIVTRAFRHH